MKTICVEGYDIIGNDQNDGIRYAWKSDQSAPLVESASFYNKTKGVSEGISGYTTSVSMGCILRQGGNACKFCRTGKLLPFTRVLTSKEIALQNVFMVLSDMNGIIGNQKEFQQREFAYMGQGEPGYAYAQVRKAIHMTDSIMKKLGQKVYRHIIATSGVEELIDSLLADLKCHYYENKVTFHFSLHSINERSYIMPIENIYPYRSLIDKMIIISKLINEKICLGVLLFNSFDSGDGKQISTRIEDIEDALKLFDNRYFRFSFCEYNELPDMRHHKGYSQDDALSLLNYVKEKGYNAKLFFSFGQDEETACGMLAGKKPEFIINEEIAEVYRYALNLVNRES